MLSNYDDRSRETHRKKRRKLDNSTTTTANHHTHSSTNLIRWRTTAEHQTYSTKLIDALRHVRTRRNSMPPVSNSRAVREAADKALATTAKGRSRWSRAILSNRVKLRLKSHKKKKVRGRVKVPPPLTVDKTAVVAPIEKRVKVLSGLVPGCRKLSFPNLLEEATDYIAALQMQVRTMAALAQLLSGSNLSNGVGPVDTGPTNSMVVDDNNNNSPVH